MINHWHRVGDFYFALTHNNSRNVVFRNEIAAASIYIISLNYSVNKGTSLYLHTTPFSDQMVVHAVQNHFTQNEYNIPSGSNLIEIPFNSKAILNKLKQLFTYLNKKNEREEFTQELMNELTKLETFLLESFRNNSKFTHAMSEKIFTNEFFAKEHVNPDEVAKYALSEFFEKTNHDASIREVKKLLINGSSVNSAKGVNNPPLLNVVLKIADLTILELLLYYGANPFKRADFGFKSAMDLAKQHNKIDKLNLMIAFYTKVERPLDKEKIIVKQLTTISKYQLLITNIKFSNDVILTTYLKPAMALSVGEKEKIYDLFAQYFEVASFSELTLKEIFYADLAEKNRIIEIICYKNQMIGFNLFEMFKTKNNLHDLYFHCMYSLMSSQIRGLGIMPYLNFRLAYALAQLLPHLNIFVMFFPVHINSAKMVRNYLHFPMYQPTSIILKVHEILNYVYKNEYEYHYHHDLLMSYVDDKVKVKGALNPNPKDFHEKFFNQQILNIDETTKNDYRASLFIFPIGDDSFKNMQEMSASLAIDLEAQLPKLTSNVQTFFKIKRVPAKEMEGNKLNYFNDSDFLFWRNQRVPVKNDCLITSQLISKQSLSKY